ncbi:hypothetical protein [Methanobrevibacter sp.]|uniref:hypothetical protein n=1 Tax=Methanobrevibacter sp. TaxID=66852 RepID=UPI0025EAE845|nr:hypothetical protein [Methanobrevibacter sp.]MBR4448375.1 hypothetical protein [Methanobrevibacter sp.]
MITVCADENINQTSADNGLITLCADENTTPILEEGNSNQDIVDLEVTILPNDHEDTVDVSWTVTVTSFSGTSKNVNLFNYIPSNLRIVGYSKDCGTFDPKTNVWTVGDIAPNTAKSIQVFGVLNKHDTRGKFTIDVNATATTESRDIDLTNNMEDFKFEMGVGPTSSLSGKKIRLNIASYSPTYKYKSYRAPAKKVVAKKVSTKKKKKR